MRRRRATLKCWLVFLYFNVFLLHRATGDKAIVLERPVPGVTGPSSWYWDVFKTVGSGWIGSSGSSTSYSVCDVGGLKPSNWLQSNAIHHNNSRKLDIAINYTMRRCSSFEEVDGRQNCSETFDVYAYQAATDLSESKPSPRNGNFSKIGTVGLSPTLASRSSGAVRNARLSLFVHERTSKVFFAIHDQGSCSNLLSFVVSYNVCPEKTLPDSLVVLPQMVAPTNASEVFKFLGRCAANSEAGSQDLFAFCNSSGEWTMPASSDRQCLCKAGWEKSVMECKVCSPGHYKGKLGNTRCTRCPGNSAAKTNRISCRCNKGFYRAAWEGITHNCTAPPSSPRHLEKEINQTTIRLFWKRPRDVGGRADLFYDVDCKKVCSDRQRSCSQDCGSQVSFLPRRRNLSQTEVTVTNLLPGVAYKFQVHARNAVSYVAEKAGIPSKHAEAEVTTLEFAPGILRVEVVKTSENAVRVSWTLDRKNGVIQAYYVSYAVVGDSENVQTIKTMETSVDIAGLKPGKTYEFVVIAENHIGSSSPSKTTFVLGSQGSSGPDTAVPVAVIAVVSTLLVIALAALVLFVLYRRRNTTVRTRPRNQRPNDGSHPREFSRDCDNVILLVNPPSDTGTQIDAVYMVVDERSSFELTRNEIKLQRVLGSGSFGVVFKAFMDNKIVAVKSLKETATPKDKQDMLTELRLMKRLQPHPHVVMLIGCCSCDDPLWIVLEYLPYGDLLGYLRKSRGHGDGYNTGEMAPTSNVTAKDLLSFSWMIADGMNYLAKMKVVHRDLAARNVLVGENKVCKISDFGLARDVEAEIYVLGTQARLPVKWMPPESLFRGESSTMSDVWSYGILLWEVFTIGDSPYPGIQANRMPSLLESGYRMPRPMHVCQELFSIMSECWSEKPESRPTFQWISTAIKRLQNDEKIYINLDEYKDEDYVNFDMFDGR